MPVHPSRLGAAAAAGGGVLGACCAGWRPDGCCPDAGGNSCPPPPGGGGAGATLAADTGCAGAAEATATAAGLSSTTALNPSTASAVAAARDMTGRTAPSSRRIELAQRRHSTARLRRPHRRRNSGRNKSETTRLAGSSTLPVSWCIRNRAPHRIGLWAYSPSATTRSPVLRTGSSRRILPESSHKGTQHCYCPMQGNH